MNPRHFSLLVKPSSADCNLNCSYCFYLKRRELYPETNIHRMNDEVLEGMIKSYMATNQENYSFAWQGGEPTLMGYDFFRKIVRYQRRYGREGSHISNALQTNATLITDRLAAHLSRYKFLVGVSLDGPEDIHNTYRTRVGGSGSHGDVLNGLKKLRQYGVEHNVLVLVSAANVEKPAQIYRYLFDLGEFYHQYIPCVEFDEEGGSLPYSITGEQWGRFLLNIFKEWLDGDTRRVSVRLFDSILSYLVDGRPGLCYMDTDCRQYFVVEYNGDIYPCDFFVQKELKLGNLFENSWEELLAAPLYLDFGHRKSIPNSQCSCCPYLKLCAGDCQKHRFRHGEDPTQLSHLCTGWKLFYKTALPEFKRIAEEINQSAGKGKGVTRSEAYSPKRSIGRNEPCYCGSGKKYKHCCGR